MGVTGLWSLIEDAGTRVDVQTLNQKILAIDLSIWINQSIKGFRDRHGRSVENAHLLGLFYRLCKLLFYQIKPIFVFDGECPTVKLRTVQKRQERIKKKLQKSKSISINVLENYINSQLQSQSSSSAKSISSASNGVKAFASQIYLPPRTYKEDVYQNFLESKDDKDEEILSKQPDNNDDYDIDFKNRPYHHPLLQNLHEIDINSESFKLLPPVTRYEILLELRESYKNRKSTNAELLPKESNSFSQFQMAKLLKKRSLQEEIEKLINEFNYVQSENNIELLKQSQNFNMDMLTSKHRSTTATEITAGALASDEQTKFFLLKTLNQAIDEFSVEDDEEQSYSIEDEIQSSIYEVPNCLPGQKSLADTDSERIELLSKTTDSSSAEFSSKKLSKKIDLNYKKFSATNNDENLNLSESDDDDSTDSEDFIEVSTKELSDENDQHEMEEFVESVPYSTDYQINIHVDKPNEHVSNEEVEIHLIDEQKNNKVEGPTPESNESSEMTVICDKAEEEIKVPDEDKIDGSTNVECKEKEILEPIEYRRPIIDLDQMIKDSKESAKLSRQANSVTNQMITDCQELLRLFGIPYIVAPGEAEAQCACLEQLGLCEGIITDDSDVFLFGGQNIYRNFFKNSKFIKRYNIGDLKKYYGLDRCKFICLGMLCGTDYTIGIDGIGPVTGMEILSQFPGDNLEPLEKFAQWYREKIDQPNSRPENSIRAKFLRFTIPNTFPSRVVFDAYQNANVDTSKEPFSWSMPQLSEIRQFASERFGWSESKTDAFLLPVLKNLNSKQTQQRIDFYFRKSNQISDRISETLKIKRSKRLNEAIRKNIQTSMSIVAGNNDDQGHSNNNRIKIRKKGKNRNISKRNRRSTTVMINNNQQPINNNSCLLSEESSSSD